MTRKLKVLTGDKKGDSAGDQVVRDLQIKKRLARFFAEARIQNALTQEEIESTLNLGPGTYRTWEQGFCLPPTKIVGKILAHFDPSTQFDFQMLFNQIQHEARALRSENPRIG